MFNFLKKRKKPTEALSPSEEPSVKDELKITELYIDKFRALHSHSEFYQTQRDALRMALIVSKEFKKEQCRIDDIIELLHPNHHELRSLRIKFLLNQKKQLINELSELKEEIQSRSDNKVLKQQYRMKQTHLKEVIEENIIVLENYFQTFFNEETRDRSFNMYHGLFEFIDDFSKKHPRNSLLQDVV